MKEWDFSNIRGKKGEEEGKNVQEKLFFADVTDDVRMEKMVFEKLWEKRIRHVKDSNLRSTREAH